MKIIKNGKAIKEIKALISESEINNKVNLRNKARGR